jgi:hypothetical protein
MYTGKHNGYYFVICKVSVSIYCVSESPITQQSIVMAGEVVTETGISLCGI